MSHTNSTTNYNLPQFVGSDKPAWLGDINPAMSAIDTQMKANADASTTAGSNATTALNGIGTLANLTTTEKSNLVGAVNELDTELGTVAGVASGASTTAGQAKTKADNLESYFNLNTFKTLTWSASSGSVSNITHTIQCSSAHNSDGSLGKIYGDLSFSVNSANGCTMKSSDTGLRPTSTFNIVGFAWKQDENGNMTPISVQFNTDGTIQFTLSSFWYNRLPNVIFVNSLLFIKDFGDISD